MLHFQHFMLEQSPEGIRPPETGKQIKPATGENIWGSKRRAS